MLYFTFEEVAQSTISSLLVERVKKTPKDVAFYFKDLGIYKGITWEEYWKEVEDFAYGLLELGLKPGDRVAIMGDPCPEWMYADLAVMSLRAIDYGVYTTSSIEEIEYLMKTGGARFFIAENQEYVDKILMFAERLTGLSKIIVIDTKATFMYKDPRLMSFSEVQRIGQQRKVRFPKELIHIIQQGSPHEIALLIFTSGTAGPPKPAALTHHNLLVGHVWATYEVLKDLQTHRHRTVSHLTMAHLFERGFTIYMPIIGNIIPHFGESVEHLQETIYEVQPTMFFGVPRIWEKFAAKAIVGIEVSSWIKKIAYGLAMKIGKQYLELRWRRKNPPLLWRLLHWISVQIAFRPLLHRLGLSKLKFGVSGGAPLPVATQILWDTWGIDLINELGATEAGGLVSSERPGFEKRGTIGKPPSTAKIRLAEDGEIMVSGSGVFRGYWNDEKTTQEVLKDGWLFLGDVGEYTEDGRLKLIDRKKDIVITSGGKNIAPTLIETALKESPYISEAILIADGRKFPSALIEIDFETVSEWARKEKVLYTGFTSLSTHPKVYELIGKEVERINQKLARVEQVKKFRIIPKELDPEMGDTTATRKIKRKRMYEMFHDMIEGMYKDVR
jgi:long-chain acyl-CoA synthetase